MLIQDARFWKGLRPDYLFAVLRIGLGLVFIIGGWKLVFPTSFGIPDHEVLAASFTDPQKGWISPFGGRRLVVC